MESGNIAVILNPASGNGKTLRLLPKVNDALEAPGAALPHPPDQGSRRCHGGGPANGRGRGDRRLGRRRRRHDQRGRQRDRRQRHARPARPRPGRVGQRLARTLGSSNNVDDAIRAACGATARAIDIGRMTFADGTSRCFVNVAGLGFDAIVAERVARSRSCRAPTRPTSSPPSKRWPPTATSESVSRPTARSSNRSRCSSWSRTASSSAAASRSRRWPISRTACSTWP